MANILLWLIRNIPTLFNAYSTLLVIYALMSWLPNARTSGFGQLIARLVEPYLNFFHRFIPPLGMVSFSVLFALLFLRLVEYGTHVVLVFLFNLLV